MKKLILISSLFVASVAFSQTAEIKIINGEPAVNHVMAPSVVGLFMKVTDYGLAGVWLQWCSGSVISKRLILTAAHCVYGRDPQNMQINFSGRTVLSETQFDVSTRVTDVSEKFGAVQVKEFIMHPEYDGYGNHDLALISLATDAPASAVPVVLLPDQYVNKAANETTFQGQTRDVLLLGYGLISESPQTETDVLRSTVVSAQFLKELVVTDQTKGSGGCNGDSGGPAFTDIGGHYYQVGVTHGPHGDSTTCHETGEWVNPALHADFLSDAAKKLIP